MVPSSLYFLRDAAAAAADSARPCSLWVLNSLLPIRTISVTFNGSRGGGNDNFDIMNRIATVIFNDSKYFH